MNRKIRSACAGAVRTVDIPAVFAGLLTVIVIGLVVENLIFRVPSSATPCKNGAHSPSPWDGLSASRSPSQHQERRWVSLRSTDPTKW